MSHGTTPHGSTRAGSSDPGSPAPGSPAPVSSAPGRRSRAAGPGRPRPDVTVVLALVVPLVAVLASLAVDVDLVPPGAVPPERTTLTRSTVTCPGLDAPVTVTTAGGSAGEVEVRRGDDVLDAPVEPGAVTTVPALRGAVAALPVEVTGRGNLAPGVVAGRFPAEGAARAPSAAYLGPTSGSPASVPPRSTGRCSS